MPEKWRDFEMYLYYRTLFPSTQPDPSVASNKTTNEPDEQEERSANHLTNDPVGISCPDLNFEAETGS